MQARQLLHQTWENAKALGLTVAVHALAAALIVVGTMEWKPFRPPVLTGMTIEAVIVDTQALKDRQQAERRAADEAVQRKLRQEQRQRDLAAQQERERQAADEQKRQQQIAAERQRQAEQEKKRQEDLRIQRLRAQQKREQEDKLKRQQAELEEIRRQREQAERERKLEEEKLKQIEARRQQEREAQQQAAAEAEMQRQLEAEQRAFQAGQLATLGDNYRGAIQAQITSNWMRPPTAQSGLRCTLAIVQIPGGEVISATIRGTCNGDEATRRSLIQAVERAGALPYRGFEDVFEREIDFIFTYDDD